jgi:hypothetical protein
MRDNGARILFGARGKFQALFPAWSQTGPACVGFDTTQLESGHSKGWFSRNHYDECGGSHLKLFVNIGQI